MCPTTSGVEFVWADGLAKAVGKGGQRKDGSSLMTVCRDARTNKGWRWSWDGL